jgi:CheY-like chemotaxis protein
MAHVLLIDSDEVARKALRGILARGGHRFAAVAKAPEAWELIQRDIKVDLVVMEFSNEGNESVDFLRALHGDCLFKNLPVIVYASAADRAAVKAALAQRVQNFLIKPYHDEHVFSEIAKATSDPWREKHFEEEKSFCALMGIKPTDLTRLLEELRESLLAAPAAAQKAVEAEDGAAADACLEALAAAAEAAGAWGVVELVKEVQAASAPHDWVQLMAAFRRLEFGARFIAVHLQPGLVPDVFMTDAERQAEVEAKERARWFEADGQGRCPVVQPAEVMRRVETLPGCPIVDTSAAMFQMLATGHPSSLVPIMERVESDPGLAAEILVRANHLNRNQEDDPTPIDDLRLCVELLGEVKLAEMSRSMVTLEERMLHALPFSWPRFWMFQIAVARMSRLTAAYLEFHTLETQAHIAGLLHDLGKLLVAHLFPYGWQAMLAYSREHNTSMAAAERRFIGCTAREVADRFARTHGLPECFRHVMRWLESPDEAEGNQELVAVVALARDLCRRNRLGHDGDQPRDLTRPLDRTRAWEVLGPRVFPAFDLHAFEAQMHAHSLEIKRELHGWLEVPAV